MTSVSWKIKRKELEELNFSLVDLKAPSESIKQRGDNGETTSANYYMKHCIAAKGNSNLTMCLTQLRPWCHQPGQEVTVTSFPFA